MNEKLSKTIALLVGVLTLTLTISYLILAWTEPSQAPPSCTAGDPGCDAPINVGTTAQTKEGDLTVKTSFYGDDILLGNWGGAVTAAGDIDIRNSAGTTVIQLDGDNGNAYFSGNVGIGKTGPNTLLHLMSATPWIRISHNDWLVGDLVGLEVTGPQNQRIAQIAIQGTNLFGGHIHFDTSVDDGAYQHRMTILEGGNVGIGNPSPAYKLDVNGTLNTTGFRMPTGASSGYVLTSDASGVGTWQAAAGGGIGGSGTDNYIPRWNGTSALENSAIYQTDTGNIGIGMTAPTAKLHVLQTTAPANPAEGGVYVYNNTANGNAILATRVSSAAGDPFLSLDIDGVYGWAIGLDDADNKFKITRSWNFDTANTALTIDTAGNVGIGTISPSQKLQVIGDLRVGSDSKYIQLRQSGGQTDIDSTHQIYINPQGTNQMILTNTGVNIAGNLTVGGTIYEGGTSLTGKYVNEGQANSVSTGMIVDGAVTARKTKIGSYYHLPASASTDSTTLVTLSSFNITLDVPSVVFVTATFDYRNFDGCSGYTRIEADSQVSRGAFLSTPPPAGMFHNSSAIALFNLGAGTRTIKITGKVSCGTGDWWQVTAIALWWAQ